MKKKVFLYKRFERVWHWLQALFIISMIFTGFEMRGVTNFLDFQSSLKLHYIASILLIILTIFAIFWHFTTGAWRQYLPTKENLFGQIKYYFSGCNSDISRPTKKSELSKLNPIQRLTYLGLKLFIIPLMGLTGIVLIMYSWLEFGKTFNLELFSTVHAIGSYMMLLFLIIHIYMTTTGHSVFSNIVAMITGFEEIEVDLDSEIQHRDFGSSVDKSEAGYYSIDTNGYLIDVNKAWLDLYGYSNKRDIIGKHFSVSRKPEDIEKLKQTINSALSGEKVKSYVVKRLCKNGEVGYHSLTANAIYEGVTIVGMEGFIIDLPGYKE